MAEQGRWGLPKLDVKKGYPKWGKDNTSTVPNDPENAINRAKGEPQNEAPGVSFAPGTKTINDGTTDVVVNDRQKDRMYYSPLTNKKNSPIGKLGPAKQHYPPCINPTCKSFGHSHPNCLCYAGPGGTSLENKTGWTPASGVGLAEGGRVCSGPHHESCEHYADGGQVESQQKFLNNPGIALDHVAAHKGLLHLLTKTGHNGQSPNEHKYLEEYADHSRLGKKTIENHTKNLIGKDKLKLDPDKESRESLKKHLQMLNENPEKAFEIGGHLGSTLPNHAAALGSLAANAFNYLNTLKPKSSQSNPLDPVIPPGKAAEAQYNRQLDIAQNPSLVLQHVQQGTAQSLDLNTLKTLYPSLHQSMVERSGDALIDAKTNGIEVPYKQRKGLSDLLGQPLDTSMTPMSMQAIMMANKPSQPPQSQGKQKKTSGVELKQIDKTNDMLATPSQSRLLDKKS
jgi:hypothetical protein